MMHFKQASLYVFSLFIVALLGLTHLHDPFTGDQALYLMGAKEIASGKVLYVDFWCDKQPGIYLFFMAAGKIFGFSEAGVHLLELLYFLIFLSIMVKALSPYFQDPWLAGFVPLSTIGMYYASVQPWLLTQLEILVAFPIFMSIWLSIHVSASRYKNAVMMFFSGVFAGFAVIFKLILAPIFPLLWLTSIFVFVRQRTLNIKQAIMNRLGPAVLGVFVVLGIVTFWFWRQHALAELVWTSFIWPFRAMRGNEIAPFHRLLSSTIIIGKIFFIWLGLSLIPLFQWRKGKRNILVLHLFVWIVASAVLIIAQRLSWWTYHFLLFYVPVGILGMLGIDELVAWCQKQRRCVRIPKYLLASILVLAASLPSIGRWVDHVQVWLSDCPFYGKEYQQAFRMKKSEKYKKIWEDTRFLAAPDAIPGRIYVFGDPSYLYLAGRFYSASVHGWTDFTPELWEKLYSQLSASPPPYIFILPIYRSLMTREFPELEKWVDKNYEVLRGNFEGTWYIRR